MESKLVRIEPGKRRGVCGITLNAERTIELGICEMSTSSRKMEPSTIFNMRRRERIEEDLPLEEMYL